MHFSKCCNPSYESQLIHKTFVENHLSQQFQLQLFKTLISKKVKYTAIKKAGGKPAFFIIQYWILTFKI